MDLKELRLWGKKNKKLKKSRRFAAHQKQRFPLAGPHSPGDRPHIDYCAMKPISCAQCDIESFWMTVLNVGPLQPGPLS